VTVIFNLTAAQPVAGQAFHGGGSYAENVYRNLVNATDVIGVYDSSRALAADIPTLPGQLVDINNETPQELLTRTGAGTIFNPVDFPDKSWWIDAPRYLMTWHGPRSLEIARDSARRHYVTGPMQKAKSVMANTSAAQYLGRTRTAKQTADFLAKFHIEFSTNTNHSKYSILNFYPEIRASQINVFYPPSEENDYATPLATPPEKYFLLTSAGRWEKNAYRAIQALDSLYSEGRLTDTKTILTGVNQPETLQKSIRNPELFDFKGYVSREDLGILHANAYAFVYPSLNEGFGYPPLQSMAAGVPVIASGITSIPEVLGDAAILFDPYSVTEIRNRLLQLSDPTIYDDYRQRGLVRYQQVKARQDADLSRLIAWIAAGQ